jgi:hypothetical protein
MKMITLYCMFVQFTPLVHLLLYISLSHVSHFLASISYPPPPFLICVCCFRFEPDTLFSVIVPKKHISDTRIHFSFP